jgi:hypothetical protein
MKIVINNCNGAFGLSKEALALFSERYGMAIADDYMINRNNLVLVEVVEQLGEAANGKFAELKVVEIPDDVQWTIEDYDGAEWVAEKHRTWN